MFSESKQVGVKTTWDQCKKRPSWYVRNPHNIYGIRYQVGATVEEKYALQTQRWVGGRAVLGQAFSFHRVPPDILPKP